METVLASFKKKKCLERIEQSLQVAIIVKYYIKCFTYNKIKQNAAVEVVIILLGPTSHELTFLAFDISGSI